ncbi:MAG: glycyl-radical enzyme activating protein [Verrucomicrobia bacterium]|nr:glycyl-radical enzyme activating protein [Verrucomicrobiota bacterium]
MSTGRIFDIQRFAIHDGPGIRTTVFLKGCPLRCIWCSNPESISPRPQMSYLAERCIACDECFKVCKPNALSKDLAGKALVDRARCTHCGDCVPKCDPKALELVGRDVSVEDVLAIVLRDRDYYEQSGGGLTLSGGEPIAQTDFVEALFCDAKTRGLHTCLETSGYADWSVLRRLLPVVDLWLYDFKDANPRLHAKFTGVSNTQIIANLRRLHAAGAPILLRCPMIPQINARKDHLDGIAALARDLPRLGGVELLPYFDFWRAKLKRLGMTTELPDSVKPPDRDTMKSWNDYLRRKGVRVVM